MKAVDSESERTEQCGHSLETGNCQLLFKGKRVDVCPQDRACRWLSLGVKWNDFRYGD